MVMLQPSLNGSQASLGRSGSGGVNTCQGKYRRPSRSSSAHQDGRWFASWNFEAFCIVASVIDMQHAYVQYLCLCLDGSMWTHPKEEEEEWCQRGCQSSLLAVLPIQLQLEATIPAAAASERVQLQSSFPYLMHIVWLPLLTSLEKFAHEVVGHQLHQHVHTDEAWHIQIIYGVPSGKMCSLHHRLFLACMIYIRSCTCSDIVRSFR